MTDPKSPITSRKSRRAISANASPDDIVEFINANLDTNPGNLVQFNHPRSHHFKLAEADDNLNLPQMMKDSEPASGWRSKVAYVSFPFCIPTKPKDCGFCPFPKVDLGDDAAGSRTEAVTKYLGHLYRELDLRKDVHALPGEGLRSVYFGGGTPNLLNPKEASEFVGKVLSTLKPRSDAEITFEGIPYLFANEEKVAALKEAGVTRVSIGAQQLKDHLIRLSGRSTQTRRTVETSVRLMQKYGLQHSIDLIYGWPQQKHQDALDDVKTAIDWGVPHLTVYPLNEPKSVAFASAPYSDQTPPISERVRMYRSIRELLVKNDYEQVTLSDYQLRKKNCYDYENLTHDTEVALFAIGYSGLTRLAGSADKPGWAWLSPHKLDDYYQQVAAARLPVRAYFEFNAADVELSWLLNQLQEMKLSRPRYDQLFGGDLTQNYANLWAALEKLGWISVTPDSIELVGDAVFYTAMIQRIMTGARDDELRSGRTIEGYRLADGSRGKAPATLSVVQ